MAYGLSAQGFRRKRTADIKTEIENTLRATLGQNINLLPQSVLSLFIGTFADREGALWELAESVYNALDPDSAEGVSLDKVCALSGITRLPAKASRVISVHLFGDVGASIPSGTAFSVAGSPESRFLTTSGVSLEAGQDEIQTIDFSSIPTTGSFSLRYNDIVTDTITPANSAADIQALLREIPYLSEVVVSGDFTDGFVINFQGADGKINHPLLLVVDDTLKDSDDEEVTILVVETQAGIPQGVVDVEASAMGPVFAPAYSLTEIENPVPGLDRILNLQKEVIGRFIETDGELRLRRVASLQRAGSSTVAAIRARLLEVQEVSEVIIFENVTDEIDGDGLDPHSFNTFVQGGDEQEIANALWLNKPAGIKTIGEIVKTVIDSQGVNQTIRFSRPVEVEIFINIEVTRDSSPTSLWPSSGADLVRAALAAYVNSLTIGDDVIVYPKLISSINAIPGIEDLEIGISKGPGIPALGSDDNIEIAINEIALITNPETQIQVTVVT